MRRGLPVEAVGAYRPPDYWMDFYAVATYQPDQIRSGALDRLRGFVAEVLPEGPQPPPPVRVHADNRVRTTTPLGQGRGMTTDSPLRTRLRTALLEARRARDGATVSALRVALSALENAEAVPSAATAGAIEQAPVGAGVTEAPRRTLSGADELALLDEEIGALHEAARAFSSSAPDTAAAARRAAEVLSALRDA